MKKVMVIMFAIMFAMVSTTSVAAANAKTGQSEWEEIWDAGEFKNEAQKICPKLKIEDIKESWWEHVYDFSYEYASDGHIPKC